ncbi:hypothetical protein NCS55_00199100 [Fusarium keratoplasticum]|nr:hypothetical protein NCS55_00199100 [Fusarium keratoplasticum]
MKLQLASTALLSSATLLLLSIGPLCTAADASEAENIKVESAANQNGPDVASDLSGTLSSPIEVVHEVVVTLEQFAGEPNTPRHVEAKKKLMGNMARDAGTWNKNHPRHRLLDALYGFSKYHERQKVELDRFEGFYKHVTKAQRALLEKELQYSKKFARFDTLLTKNQDLCNRIVQNAMGYYEISQDEFQKHAKEIEASGKTADRISVSQALKHYVRDWTEEGASERNGPFSCLIKTLEGFFPERDGAAPIKALVPGSGLGRLGHDIARLGGFEVTMNEWSMYMNLAYRLVEANRARNSMSWHPFVEGWSHHVSEADMTRELLFPDVGVNASSVVLVEGDFTTAFIGKRGKFDVVVTYFFIDTARNLMSYLDTIKRVLKPGGHWINLGPLLYGSGPYVQLSLDEVLRITEVMGFEYLDTEESCGPLTLPERKVRSMEAVYGFNNKALTKSAYNAQFWVAKRSMKD